MGRYCSYLLPKQAGGTTQILFFKTLRMIGRPALYTHFTSIAILEESRDGWVDIQRFKNVSMCPWNSFSCLCAAGVAVPERVCLAAPV